MPSATCSTVTDALAMPWVLGYHTCMVEKDPMTYVPHQSWIPQLQVPENRVKYVHNYYKVCANHPNNFPAYAYWIERCNNDGSDY